MTAYVSTIDDSGSPVNDCCYMMARLNHPRLARLRGSTRPETLDTETTSGKRCLGGRNQQDHSALSFDGLIDGIPGRVLVDSGSGSNIIAARFAKLHQLEMRDARPVTFRFANGSSHRSTSATSVCLTVGEYEAPAIALTTCELTDDVDVILGRPWLRETNPVIDWRTGSVCVDPTAGSTPPPRGTATSCGSAGDVAAVAQTAPNTVAPPTAAPAAAAQVTEPRAVHSCDDSAAPGPRTTSGPHPTQQQPGLGEEERQQLPVRATGVDIAVISARQCARLLRKPGMLQQVFLISSPTPTAETEQLETHEERPPDGGSCSDPVIAATLSEFAGVFEAPKLPELRIIGNHAIDLVPGAEPPARPPFRLSQAEDAELRRQLDQLIEDGLVSTSVSPFGAPILFVKKKDGTLRLCVDYRLLNKLTIRDAYPLPRIQDLLDDMKDATVFSKMDLKTGYYQLRMLPEDEHKTAFSTRYGTFQWKVLPLGLCNAPATFQRTMDQIFKSVKGRCMWIYLDDLIVFSKNISEHREHIKEIFQLLAVNNLRLARPKCEFARETLQFLGHTISPGFVGTEAAKTEAIHAWPTPNTVRELQAFLGLANYYRRFIKNFAAVAAPLTDLVGGPAGSTRRLTTWSATADRAFQTLKAALVSAPVLAMPRTNGPYRLICDASDLAVGAILEQDWQDGEGFRPVAYASKRLSAAEVNYDIRNKELLAVTYGLRQFRVYLLGAPFTILTDHESLKYLLTQKDLTGRLARWAELLADYDLEIRHIRGRDNPADVLSRPPSSAVTLAETTVDLEAHPTDDHDDQEAGRTRRRTAATPIAAITSVRVELSQPTSTHGAKTGGDAFFDDIIAALRNPNNQTTTQHIRLRAARFVFGEDGHLYLREGMRRCITEYAERLHLLQETHDGRSAGHQGVDRTIGRLVRVAFWPSLVKDVRDYVGSCDACQRNKPPHQYPHAAHQPLEVPNKPWEDVSMDFMSMPPSPRGNDTLLVVNDLFSSQLHLIPTVATADATTTANLFISNIFRLHGLPSSIVSDRDPRFTGEVWGALWKSLGARLRMSVAHRPQADGATERANRAIQEVLRAYVNSLGSDWDDPATLATAEFALNSSTKNGRPSAFEMATGLMPKSAVDLLPNQHSAHEPANMTSSAIAGDLRRRLALAKEALHTAKERQAKSADLANPPHQVHFAIGQQVLLSTQHYPQFRLNKLAAKFIGPFRVTKVRGANVTLDLPRRFRIHKTMNMESLRPFRESTRWPGRTTAPPPPIPASSGNGGLLFTIEKFLQERTFRGKPQLLVRWAGYGPAEDSWEPLEDVAPQSPLLLQQFLANKPPPLTKSTSAAEPSTSTAGGRPRRRRT